MEHITGDNLNQILQILGVKTVGIETMADLLNPVKLFPNSFQALTVQTSTGVKGIYNNAQGSVNTNLVNSLPAWVLSSTVANAPVTAPYTGTLPIPFEGYNPPY